MILSYQLCSLQQQLLRQSYHWEQKKLLVQVAFYPTLEEVV